MIISKCEKNDIIIMHSFQDMRKERKEDEKRKNP